MQKIPQLTEAQLARLVDNRWNSSDSIWDIVVKTYDRNTKIYKNEPEWLAQVPRKKSRVRANRIFVNQEAVINTLIANPPKPLVLPTRDNPESKEIASSQEKYFQIKYDERNVKEVLRKGLRNLYFSRLVVLKPYWDARINDFNVRALDPRKVRISKSSTKEDDSEFVIEEISDSLLSVMRRFPKKKSILMQAFGYESEEEILIENPEVVYKEAWIREYVIFKYGTIILGVVRNPYWDWDGILITKEEEDQIASAFGDTRRNLFAQIKMQQDTRKAASVPSEQPVTPIGSPVPTDPATQQSMPSDTPEEQGTAEPTPQNIPLPADTPATLEFADEPQNFKSYFFNHFDNPRKPYIFATLFNNENTPIGQTDMISQAAPLQENIDERKRDITENAKIMNGVIKVDSEVMDQANAQKLRFEAQGIIYGKNVVAGVQRETGPALPAFMIEDMYDSRKEIDNIMAASDAFRGERQGSETKAGRLALIDQSYNRLNEMVQVTDYLCYELFNWWFQLAKVKYTEHHYAKTLGKEMSVELLTLKQEDLEDGTEVRITAGKMLPTDREFKYNQAQEDYAKGLLSGPDYLQIAGYDNPRDVAKDGYMWKVAPASVVGLTPEDQRKIPQPQTETKISQSVAFNDLPPTAKAQMLEKIGIQTSIEEIAASEVASTMLKNHKPQPSVMPMDTPTA